jgi:pimeloyl-ACP methyl ester carboxylesterase
MPGTDNGVLFRFPAAGVTLTAERHGDDGPVIVLLHGGGQTRRAWRQSARRLAAQGWTALAVDLRGHGESDWAADGGYDIGDFAADVEAFLAQWSSPVVVGASLGGLAALVALGESGDKGLARGLVLVDIAPRIEVEGAHRVLAFMQQGSGGFSSVDEAADAVARYLPHRPRPHSTAGLEANLRRREDGRLYWHWDPSFLQSRMEVRVPGEVGEYERFRQAAQSISVPVLVVRGEQSDVLTKESLDEVTRLIPGAEVTEVPGAGHMVAGDRNDEFYDAMSKFLQRLA